MQYFRFELPLIILLSIGISDGNSMATGSLLTCETEFSKESMLAGAQRKEVIDEINKSIDLIESEQIYFDSFEDATLMQALAYTYHYYLATKCPIPQIVHKTYGASRELASLVVSMFEETDKHVHQWVSKMAESNIPTFKGEGLELKRVYDGLPKIIKAQIEGKSVYGRLFSTKKAKSNREIRNQRLAYELDQYFSFDSIPKNQLAYVRFDSLEPIAAYTQHVWQKSGAVLVQLVGEIETGGNALIEVNKRSLQRNRLIQFLLYNKDVVLRNISLNKEGELQVFDNGEIMQFGFNNELSGWNLLGLAPPTSLEADDFQKLVDLDLEKIVSLFPKLITETEAHYLLLRRNWVIAFLSNTVR